MKTDIITDTVQINNIRKSETSFDAFEADWSSSAEDHVEAVEEALRSRGFKFDRVGAILGLFDTEGRDATVRESREGTVHFRSISRR